MKVDGLGVVLAIILLPIILVTTYYVQLQVKTIATENSYNTKLLNATYDAMSAFEINTANEELSSVADSMRSIVLASNNVFLNSLATNLGVSNASRENLRPYIPAVLYTMYDGYYIYAPTEIPIVAEHEETINNGENVTETKGYRYYGEEEDSIEDSQIEGADKAIYGDILYKSKSGGGKPYTINKDNADTKTDYVLKSYVQYSAQYNNNNNPSKPIDITINYTLDNYLNIVGTIGDVYYTKTGYLINPELVTTAKAKVNDNEIDLKNYNEDQAKNKILGVKTNAEESTTNAASEAWVKLDNVEIKASWSIIEGVIKGFSYDNIKTISEAETCLKRAYDEEGKNVDDIRTLEYEIQKYKAIAYYTSSAIFSNWVYDNLKDLTYDNIKDQTMTGNYTSYQSTTGEKDFYYDFHNDAVKERKIFDDTDPEQTTSNFNTHKMEVIKNSIKHNLNLSISAYCKMNNSYDFSMPILLDEEWDKILQNISIVAFMQGLDCGLNIYNNYEMVSSTNNELTVTPSEIYYVPKGKFNDEETNYHRIDCPELVENDENDDYISFKSKEVKYDKIYASNRYQYDHKNLACYKCINTDNYYTESLFFNKNATSYYQKINSLMKTSTSTSADSKAKKRAGYIAIAKERQNIYKTNALPVSEGYKIYENIINGNPTTIQLKELKELKELQITLKVNNNNNNNNLETAKIKVFDNNNNNEIKDIRGKQTTAQTVSVDVSNWNGTQVTIRGEDNFNSFSIQSIKAIYK